MKNFRKDKWLVILFCVNLLLITGMVFQFVGLPQAQAQVQDHNYILIPGNLNMGKQIVWLIDLRTHQLTSCMYNFDNRTIDFGQIIDLTNQF